MSDFHKTYHSNIEAEMTNLTQEQRDKVEEAYVNFVKIITSLPPGLGILACSLALNDCCQELEGSIPEEEGN